VNDVPALLQQFRGRSFVLLWRGGFDGFSAQSFHSHCDGHCNTLTIIEDDHGNVFGGFTPVPWESRTRPPYEVADRRLESFLFAFPDRQSNWPIIFELRREHYRNAIFSRAKFGPRFGVADLLVSDFCNRGGSHTDGRGQSYVIDDRVPFMKGQSFTVAEIETFEVS
jgi:hypothetical protein